MKPDNVDELIHAAEIHGRDSEPDHEVGDLQELLRAAYELMTVKQQDEFLTSEAARDVWTSAYGD